MSPSVRTSRDIELTQYRDMDPSPAAADRNDDRSATLTLGVLGLLALLSPVGFLLLLPGLYFIYGIVVPAHSAEIRIPEIGATVRLDFHYTWSVHDDGRYLTVRTRRGSTTVGICGYKWTHRARTSVYLTEDGKVAVLGSENGCDALASVNPLGITARFQEPSESWRYLGAFDFTPVTYERALRFFPASEQRECVPRSGSAERPVYGRHRERAWGPCDLSRLQMR
jgi:hypothetical protein